MANYSTLKGDINDTVKTNGSQSISGAALNTILNEMVTSLGTGYNYMGVAVPTTNPGTPDPNVFYLASQAGTYTNFGGLVVNEGEVCALVFNGSWSKQVTGAATQEQLSQLGQKKINHIPFIIDGGVELNKYFRELYITGLAAGTIYCIRELSVANGVAKLVIGTSSGVTWQILNIPLNEKLFTYSAGAYSIYAVFCDLDTINGTVISGNTDTSKGTINADFCFNKYYSPICSLYIDSLTPAGYPFINVNKLNNKNDAYGNKAVARVAVLSALRIKGVVLTYLVGTSWVLEQYIGSTWNDESSWLTLSYEELGGIIASLAYTKLFGADEIVATNLYDGYIKTDGTLGTGNGKTYDVQLSKGTIVKIESRAWSGACQFAKVIESGVKYEPIIISKSSSLVNETFYFFIQESGTYAVSSWGSYIHLYTSLSDALNAVFDASKRLVEKQVEYVYLTANSDENSGADYTGNLAIRNAIAAIVDASHTKQYIIRCTGDFVADLPSDYAFDAGLGSGAMFWLKDYVHLDGGNPNQCRLRASLPDSLAACQADTPSFVQSHYGTYQPIFIRTKSDVRNITISTRNGRYAYHLDGGSYGVLNNASNTVENCVLIHEGKYGDAIGTTGGAALGMGVNSGQNVLIKNCILRSSISGIAVHDNTGFIKKSKVLFDSCDIQTTTMSATNGITAYSGGNGNPVGYDLEVRDCRLMPFAYCQISDKTAYKDIFGFSPNVQSNGDPLPVYNTTDAIALRIKSATQSGSSVRFNEDSSAFDVIVGNSGLKAYAEINQYGRSSQFGYMWRDGGVGLNAEAVGTLNLRENGTFNIGKRLGDCSGTSKTLNVIIDGVEHSIVFNQDYTSMTNDEVLAVINTAISGYGVADYYKVSLDYYPGFSGLASVKVSDTTAVLAGMGVIFTTDGCVRRAKSTDSCISGIALDNGADGQVIRIITKGGVGYKNGRFCIYQTENLPSSSVTPGLLFGISSDNDGEFTSNTSKYTTPLLRSNFGATIQMM